MRALCLLAVLLPTPLWAEDFTLYARPTAVTVYPSGALVAREVPFDLPAGQHRLLLGGLPDLGEQAFDLKIDGAALLGATFRRARAELPDAALPPAVLAAKNEMLDLQAELAAERDRVAEIRAGAEAAAARIEFLAGLGDSDGAPALPLDDLRALARMVGAETGTARAEAIAAEARARTAELALADLQRRVREAETRYDQLRGPDETAQLVATVQSNGGDGLVTVSNFTDGRWQPVYDFRLDVSSDAVAVDRSVLVRQDSAENWVDVALTLSTDQPAQALGAADYFDNLRRIDDPVPPHASARMEEAPLVEPVLMMDRADGAMAATYDGLAVTYSLPRAVTVLRADDAALFRLDGFTLDARVFAVAIPANDATAHVTASVANTADEILLPADLARFHVVGRFVGTEYFAGLVPGEEAELAFGPIAGLQLQRTVLNRLEGDRGVISRSNQKDEEVLIEVENRTPRAWDVRLRDAVNYSEQEDLRITWSATPDPDATDVDNRRGVLQWNLTLEPGAKQEIRVQQRLSWPEDKVLR